MGTLGGTRHSLVKWVWGGGLGGSSQAAAQGVGLGTRWLKWLNFCGIHSSELCSPVQAGAGSLELEFDWETPPSRLQGEAPRLTAPGSCPGP